MSTRQEHPVWFVELEDVFQCGCCFKLIMDPPVYKCDNGDTVCNICYEEKRAYTDRCICGGCLGTKRSSTLEKILERLPKTKCKFEGCMFSKAELKLVQEHEDRCQFDPEPSECFLCRVSLRDNRKVPLKCLHQHVTEHHGKEAKVIRAGVFEEFHRVSYCEVPCMTIQKPLKVKVGGESAETLDFFFNVVTYHKFHRFWVSHTFSKQDSREYYYTISLNDGKTPTERRSMRRRWRSIVQHTELCHSASVTQEEMNTNMKGLIVRDEDIENASDIHKFRCEVLITKKLKHRRSIDDPVPPPPSPSSSSSSSDDTEVDDWDSS